MAKINQLGANRKVQGTSRPQRKNAIAEYAPDRWEAMQENIARQQQAEEQIRKQAMSDLMTKLNTEVMPNATRQRFVNTAYEQNANKANRMIRTLDDLSQKQERQDRQQRFMDRTDEEGRALRRQLYNLNQQGQQSFNADFNPVMSRKADIDIWKQGATPQDIAKANAYRRERNAAEMQRSIDEARELAHLYPVMFGAPISSVGGTIGSAMATAAAFGSKLRGDQDIDINDPIYRLARQAEAAREGTVSGVKKAYNIQDYDENGNRTFASKASDFLVQSGLSMLDTAMRSSFLGPVLGSTQASVGALSDRFIEGKERGESDTKALTAGLAHGIVEGVTEKYSLESLHALQDSPVDSARAFIINMAKHGFTEGSEEFFADWLNAVSDLAILGNESEWATTYNAAYRQAYANALSRGIEGERAEDYAKNEATKAVIEDTLQQSLMSFAGGALSGLLLGGGVQLANRSLNQQVGQQLVAQDTALDAASLPELANTISVNPELYRDENGFVDTEALQQAEDTRQYLNNLAERSQGRELTPQEQGAAYTEILRTPYAVNTEGFQDGFINEGFDADDALMGLAMEQADAKEQQRQAVSDLAEQYYNENKAMDDDFQRQLDSATMLSQEEKYQAVQTGIDTATRTEMDRIKGESYGRQETGENGYRAGSERLLGDRTGEQGSRGSGSERALGEVWKAEARTFRDSEAATLRAEKAQSADQVISTALKGQAVYTVSGDTKETSGAKAIADAQGVKNHILYASKDGGIYVANNGKTGFARGSFDPETDTITSCVNNPYATSKQITEHETVHRAIAHGQVNVQKIINNIGITDTSLSEDVEDAVQAYMEWSGGAYDHDLALEEVLCDIGGEINQFELYEGQDDGEIDDLAEIMREITSKIRPMLNEAMGGAFDAEAQAETAETLARVNASIDVENGSVNPLFSERLWNESMYVKYRDSAIKKICEAINVSKKQAAKYIDDINSVAKMISNDRTRYDYTESGLSPFVSNAEYGGSFDFDTLCVKRRIFIGTFQAIQGELPNTALTRDEVLAIRKMMDDQGLEVPCGKCYVEGSRAAMGEFTKKFLELYKKYYPNNWQPNMLQANTPDGIEWIRLTHPECYEQYEYFWNHYGTLRPGDPNLFASQQKPKLYMAHSAYSDEILREFKDAENDVKAKNRNGGIRFQSFSDFEIIHCIDAMQAIMDMSVVGLAGQAYTKQPQFALAFGNTGMKINLSIDAWGVDENGKLIFNNKEGMPFETAMELRNKYSDTVGTICCVYDDQMLLAALADDRIDFIIPFHRSQWKKSQYKAMGLPSTTKDYTYQQNEKWLEPSKHVHLYKTKKSERWVKTKCMNYMPNEYWDFNLSGKENAEKYLEMCYKDGKRPKFYRFLDKTMVNGKPKFSLKKDGSTDGYWKLLIDFKMYNNDGVGVPQMPVKPNFNMDEIRKMFDEYAGDHHSYPVAQGVVDEFVSKYKANHPGAKFSSELSPANKQTYNQNIENTGFNVNYGLSADGQRISISPESYINDATWKKIHNAINKLGYGMPTVDSTKKYVLGGYGLQPDQTKAVKKILGISNETEAPYIDPSEAKKIAQKAEKHFGTTTSFNKAAYITVNGKLLDFSEGQGYRVQDHREISDILDLPEDAGYSDGLIEFMNQGNIRLQTYGADIAVEPNATQRSILTRFINSLNGEFVLDLSNDKGHNIASVEYPEGTRAAKILADIDRYFKDDVIPDTNSISNFHMSYSSELSPRNAKAIRKITDDSVDAMLDNGYTAQEAAEAVETGGVVSYSTRLEAPPKKTIIAYKAFYAMDGKLYPPMVSNDVETIQNKGKKKVSGTLKGLETPVGVWINADVGRLAYGKDGKPLRNTYGRLAVKNDKGGGTLAFRPGWHLGLWPDAKQFNVMDPVTGELKACMPDGLVFARCSVAADYDYQLEALSYGVKSNGNFDRTQAGLPRIPNDGYYMYRTNPDPTTAPWIITGAIKVEEILDDDMSAEICAKYGITADPRASHKKINLADYGLKAGPVTPTEDMDRFLPNDAVKANASALEEALADPDYADAYLARHVNFDDPKVIEELARNKQNAAFYKEAQEKYGNKSYAVNNPNDPLIDKNTFAYSSELSPQDAPDEYSMQLKPDENALRRSAETLHQLRNMRTIDEVKQRNERLAALDTEFNDALTGISGSSITTHQVNQIASKYINGLKADEKQTIRHDIGELYELLGNTTKTNARQLTEVAVDIADRILQGGVKHVQSPEAKALSKELKSTKFWISPELKKAIEYHFGSYTEFRRIYGKFMGMKLTPEKTSRVDTWYAGKVGQQNEDDLRGVSRAWFPSDIINEADQLLQIADVARQVALGEEVQEDYGDDYDEVMYTMANEIIADYFKANGNVKYMQKIEKVKQEMREEYEAKLDYIATKYNDKLAKNDEKVAKEQAKFLKYKEDQRNKRFSKAQRDRLWKRIRDLKKMKGNPQFEAEKAAIFEEISAVRKGALSKRTIDNLTALKEQTEKADMMSPTFSLLHHKKALEAVQELDRKHVGEMSEEEIAAYLRAVTELITYQRNENRLLDESKGKYVSAEGKAGIKQQLDVKGIDYNSKMSKFGKTYILNSLAPTRALPMLDGYVPNGFFGKTAQKFFDGEMRTEKYRMEAEKMFSEWLEDEKYMRDLTREKVTLKNHNGQTIEVTKDIALAWYLAGADDGNVQHTEAGGWIVPDEKTYLRGDFKNSYNNSTRFVMNLGDYQQLNNVLSDKDKAFAETAREYFDEFSRKHMDEVSMKLYGWKLSKSGHYLPIIVDKDVIPSDIDVYSDPTLENSGFTKARKNSKLAIRADGLTNILKRSINNVSRYYGLAIPLRDFNSVMNYAGYANPYAANPELRSMKGTFKSTWGTTGDEYVSNLVSDLNRGSRDRQKDLLDYVYMGYGSAVLGANVRVMLSQASSYPMALSILHADSLAKGLAARNNSVDMDYIDSITPSMYMRRKGMTGTQLGEMYGTRQKLSENKAFAPIMKSLDVLTSGIQKVDVWTTTHLVSACEAEMETYYPQYKKGTQAYDRKLAELIEQVNSRTQPSYSTMNRNEFSKRPGAGYKILTMFKTQTFNMYGEVADAVGRDIATRELAKKGLATSGDVKRTKDAVARAVVGMLLSQVMFEAIKKAVNLLVYHDPEDARDEQTGEVKLALVVRDTMEKTLADIISMPPGLGSVVNDTLVPIFKSLTGKREDMYDIDAPGLGTINDIRSSANYLAQAIKTYRDDPTTENRNKMLTKTAKFGIKLSYFGYPLQNLYNTVNGIWMNVAYRPFNYENGRGLFGLKDNSPDKAQYAGMAVAAAVNGDKDKAVRALGNTNKEQLSNSLGIHVSDKLFEQFANDPDSMKDYLNIGQEVRESFEKNIAKANADGSLTDREIRDVALLMLSNGLSSDDAYKLYLTRKSDDKTAAEWVGNGHDFEKYLTGRNEMADAKEIKDSDKKLDTVVGYLKDYDGSKEEKQILWKLAGYGDSTYNKNNDPNSKEYKQAVESARKKAENDKKKAEKAAAEKARGVTAETKDLAKEIDAKIPEDTDKYLYVSQSTEYTPEQKVQWFKADSQRTEGKKYKAWKNAGGADYDYIKYRGDLSRYTGMSKSEKKSKVTEYINSTNVSVEKKRVMWTFAGYKESTCPW